MERQQEQPLYESLFLASGSESLQLGEGCNEPQFKAMLPFP
jgi:hypothetical protein